MLAYVEWGTGPLKPPVTDAEGARRRQQFRAYLAKLNSSTAVLDALGYDRVWRWRTCASPWHPGVRVEHPFADRVGQRLRVVARGAMNSALVEFADGTRAVVSRNAFRKAA